MKNLKEKLEKMQKKVKSEEKKERCEIPVKYTPFEKDKYVKVNEGEAGYSVKMYQEKLGYGRVNIIDKHDKQNLQNEVRIGDILITQMTDPADEPKMLKCSAIMTERTNGKTLSHAALVSNQFGINCILGLEGIMNQFKTGDTLYYRLNEDNITGEIYTKK